MAIVTLQELIENGVHYGCQSARWNPKMKPYIHSKKNKIHIIDLRETLKGLIRAYHFIKKLSAQGKKVLFVGTQRHAADIIREEATRSDSHFVCHRWLGGTMTNLPTMRDRILRLDELEHLDASGEIHDFSKKMISMLTRERKKIFRNFEGTRQMKELPAAVVVIDPRSETIALAECHKLGIPVIAICDTDCDPDPIDFVIPANDDSGRSLRIILSRLADAAIEGRRTRRDAETTSGGGDKKKAEEKPVEKDIVPENLEEMGSFSFGGESKED
jgi:small subunit ribosomal protein S2